MGVHKGGNWTLMMKRLLICNAHQLCSPLNQPFPPDVLHDNHVKIFALPLPFDHTSKEGVCSQPSSSSYLTQTREEGRLWCLSTSPDDTLEYSQWCNSHYVM